MPLSTNHPEIHGHRGSRGTHPENTIPAFEEAAACGAEFLELDLQLTADDVPMVFHDPAVSSRLCRKDGQPVATPIPVRQLTAAQMSAYECGEVAQRSFPQQKLISGIYVPTFEAVLRWAATSEPPIGLNVEIKQEALIPEQLPDPEQYARVVVDLIRRYRLLGRTRIQSFDFAPLRAAKRLEPSLTMACLFEEKRDFIAETLATGAQVVAPFFEMLSEPLVRDCHARGLRVIPWTVNDPKWWRQLTEWGIDGIITDYPRRLAEFFKDAS